MIDEEGESTNHNEGTNANHPRILLAEDNPSNRKVTMKMLDRLGYKADAVLNGHEAIEALERQQYDLVLMDVVMPKMSGFDATKEIRRRFPASKQPKIIALTAYVIPNSREICLESGMDDFLGKPIQIKDLENMIRSHLHAKGESVA
jgi:CheY-like chemotaxis protein